MPATVMKLGLPRELGKAVEQFIAEHPGLGFTSVASFVTDATRKSMEHYMSENVAKPFQK